MTNLKDNRPYVFIISGLTASGKTALSLSLAKHLSGEIINADMGQFYSLFSVGTAKPLWKQESVSHHLFDIIDEPKSLSVNEYRKLALQKIESVWERGRLPIIVGGSLFYLKSLFFPPLDFSQHTKELFTDDKFVKSSTKIDSTSWDRLNTIDPQRAESLHPNDLYRIERALEIWQRTNIKPSVCKPKFTANFHSYFLFLNPSLKVLEKKINQRTEEMIGSGGWIEEVENVMGTKWEIFLRDKKLIGYSEILNWLKEGKQREGLQPLIQTIQTKTKQYAQKQQVFWKSFCKELKVHSNPFLCRFTEFKKLCDEKDIKVVAEQLYSDLERYRA